MLVVAGPNGSGKSTISAALATTLFRGVDVIDPDAKAGEHASAMRAGRTSIAAVDTALALTRSLIVETTLAGSRGVRLMRKARSCGYRVALLYICTASPEISLQRVAARVAAGGHDVPERDVRRRYARSLARLPEALAIAGEFTLFDNTERSGPRVIAHGFAGAVIHRSPNAPAWASAVLGRARS